MYLRGMVAFLSLALLIVLFPVVRCGTTSRLYRLSEKEYIELQQACGRITLDQRLRVAGGKPAEQGKFPSALRLVRKDGMSDVEVCSAAVISRLHIITAAHCFEFDKSKIVKVNVCDAYYALGGSPCTPSKRKTIIEEKMRYGRVLPSEPITDFAVLELEAPLDARFADIRPLCLPKPSEQLPIYYMAFGYGSTESEQGNEVNVNLHYLNGVKAISELECITMSNLTGSDCERVIAFRSPQYNKSLCKGDSGGGVIGMVNGRQTLFGVISVGEDACDAPDAESYVAVATRLSYHHDFICLHTGICPLGYDKYSKSEYPTNAEPFVYMDVQYDSILPARLTSSPASVTTSRSVERNFSIIYFLILIFLVLYTLIYV